MKGDQLSVLTAEFDKVMKAGIGKTEYPPGQMARLSFNEYGHIPETVKLFRENSLQKAATDYFGAPTEYMLQIFMTWEYKLLDKDNWSRNQHLHFDPYHAYKYLLFLTDVDKELGAFACVPGTTNIGRILRGRNSLEQNLKTFSYSLDAHKDYAHLEDELVYMEGKAGMLLVIDTDTIHGGGVLLKDGLERKVINIHSRRR